jgi:hypothetical protein
MYPGLYLYDRKVYYNVAKRLLLWYILRFCQYLKLNEMVKYLIWEGNSCDLTEVLSSNLLRGTERNYGFLRIDSIPVHIRNWYLPNTARNMNVYTRLIYRST